jgi:hypothetical protein
LGDVIEFSLGAALVVSLYREEDSVHPLRIPIAGFVLGQSAELIARSAGIFRPIGANPNRLPENLNSPFEVTLTQSARQKGRSSELPAFG